MHLSKHHGLGNDFLVLLRDDVVPMPDDVAAALAIRLCHRTRGIGADGLLIGGPPVRRIACDLQMWLYNADGSRAEMSGNGIRCLAQAVLRDRGLTEATLAISTDGGLRRVDAKVVSDDTRREPSDHTVWASVDMGAIERDRRAERLAWARPRPAAAGGAPLDRKPARRRSRRRRRRGRSRGRRPSGP